jgi:NAD+ kinase
LKNVVLCTNPRRDTDFRYTLAVRKLMLEKGITPRHSILFPTDDMVLPEGIDFTPLSEALSGAQLLICFGGDGTILQAAREAARNSVPILGVNVGNMGFLADLESFDYKKVIMAVDKKYTVDRRMMLHAEVMRDGKVIFSDFALNDAVVSKSAARIIRIAVFGNGKIISHFAGDGLIVATPTGSTAYSMSAGGPIVEPSSENLIVTPICAHDLSAKSFVLSSKTEVTVELGTMNDKVAVLSLDGADSALLLSGDKVKVTKSKYFTDLVRVNNRSFYEIVSQKLDTND